MEVVKVLTGNAPLLKVSWRDPPGLLSQFQDFLCDAPPHGRQFYKTLVLFDKYLRFVLQREEKGNKKLDFPKIMRSQPQFSFVQALGTASGSKLSRLPAFSISNT